MKKQCPFCSEEIQQTAIKCKHCGEFLNKGQEFNDLRKAADNMSNKQAFSGCLIFIITIIILGGCLSTCSNSKPETKATEKPAPEATRQNKWYDGGTLHKANALEWQKASYSNKLATCADFISKLYRDNKLSYSISSKIKSVDDIKPFASELLIALDEAFKQDSDPVMNKRLYSNQKVAGTAIILLATMKWLKQ